VAPFRDPDDPVRCDRCGAGRADRDGSIAASISVSGNAFEVTSTQLRGTGFEQFGSIATQASGTQHPVAVSVIRKASLQSLCQSVAVGPFTLVLRAGASRRTPSSLPTCGSIPG
jgi:hypothetical protein